MENCPTDYWPPGGCKECDYVEPRKFRCRATEALKHVGEYVHQEELSTAKERPPWCPLYKAHNEKQRIIREIHGFLQRKTRCQYRLSLSKLDAQELRELLMVLRAVEQSGERHIKMKVRRRYGVTI